MVVINIYFNTVEEIQNGKNIFIIGLNASRVFINLFNPQITVLDPFSLFCPNRICKYFNKNLSLFLDNNHLNGVFIKNRVIEYFSRMLKIPSICDYRTNIYQCELRRYKLMNYESKMFAVSIKIKILKTLYPKPIIYTGKLID